MNESYRDNSLTICNKAEEIKAKFFSDVPGKEEKELHELYWERNHSLLAMFCSRQYLRRSFFLNNGKAYIPKAKNPTQALNYAMGLKKGQKLQKSLKKYLFAKMQNATSTECKDKILETVKVSVLIL